MNHTFSSRSEVIRCTLKSRVYLRIVEVFQIFEFEFEFEFEKIESERVADRFDDIMNIECVHFEATKLAVTLDAFKLLGKVDDYCWAPIAIVRPSQLNVVTWYHQTTHRVSPHADTLVLGRILREFRIVSKSEALGWLTYSANQFSAKWPKALALVIELFIVLKGS